MSWLRPHVLRKRQHVRAPSSSVSAKAKRLQASWAEIDAGAWATLHSDTSRPFEKPKNGRIAVKVINHLGDEVMKVLRVQASG